VFLLNSWLNHFTETTQKVVGFIPKLQPQFA
jgi:hypothetical protein